MAFDAVIQHWPTISAFNAYLQGVSRPKWVKGITCHNTYKPNDRTWAGLQSMQSMLKHYRDTNGWSSGPHLYLAAHAPNPAHTGVWQLTPITRPGTHAGDCNDDHLGIEWVGDFDARPPTAAQYTMGIAVNLLILRHWGLPPEAVNVHNECMVGRTCPGKYVTGTQIRADLRKVAPRPPPTPIPTSPRPCRVVGLPIYQRSDHTGALAGHLITGEHVAIDDLSNGHLVDARGFVDITGLETL